jgi:hypothetical protein
MSTLLEAQAVDGEAAEVDARLDAELLGLAMVVIDRGGTPEDVLNVAIIQRSVFEWWKAWGREILEEDRLADAEMSRRRLSRSLSSRGPGGGPRADGTREGCAVFQISDSRRERCVG